jgi:hypothetical protein
VGIRVETGGILLVAEVVEVPEVFKALAQTPQLLAPFAEIAGDHAHRCRTGLGERKQGGHRDWSRSA